MITKERLDIIRQTALNIRKTSDHNHEKMFLYIVEMYDEIKRLKKDNEDLKHQVTTKTGTADVLNNENMVLLKRIDELEERVKE